MGVTRCNLKTIMRGSESDYSIVHAGVACTLPHMQTARRGMCVGNRWNVQSLVLSTLFYLPYGPGGVASVPSLFMIVAPTASSTCA
jgi:hypothetical protein